MKEYFSRSPLWLRRSKQIFDLYVKARGRFVDFHSPSGQVHSFGVLELITPPAELPDVIGVALSEGHFINNRHDVDSKLYLTEKAVTLLLSHGTTEVEKLLIAEWPCEIA